MKIKKLIEKLWRKLKGLFTMTPEEIEYATNELRFLFGLSKPSQKDESPESNP
jgi:hypothetical protein